MAFLQNNVAPKAHFVFDWKFMIAATFLLLVMWELHELVHILSGYLYCGEFGHRDFNVWGLADDCRATRVPTYLGPVFTIGMGFVAAALLFSASPKWRAFGIGLFWAVNPLTRLLTVMIFGGNDEAYGIYNTFELQNVEGGFALAERMATIILFLASWPLFAALCYKVPRRLWLWLPVIIFAPIATAMAVLLLVYIPLYGTGWLGGAGLFGGSLLVTIVSVFNLIICALTLKWLWRVPTSATQSDAADGAANL